MNLSYAIGSMIAQAAPAGQAPADDSQWMVYAIIAFGCAIALMVLEAFIPSGGVLGVLAAVCAIGGIVMFFRFDTTWGMVSMAVTLIAAPFVMSGLLWVWPNTPIGRALTLGDEPRNDPVETSEAAPAITVGVVGEALTELRPVGSCRLNGLRIDCIAQTGMIKPGTKVRVISVDSMTIRVKPV